MHKTRILIMLFLAITAVMGLLAFSINTPALAQGQNLLSNPGFEGQYSSYVPEAPQEIADCPLGICTTAQTPSGWKPWWVKERPTDVNPEFKPAVRAVGGNRVRTGDRAAQYFSFWSTHKAGLRQTVTVPANAVVQFSVWGHAWMSESDTSFVSDYSGTPNMRIGIDPTGGTNPYGAAVVWSEYKQAYDSYQQFAVQAQASGDRVTVFTFSAPSVNPNSPDYGFKHTDIYWDDASLAVVGAGAAAPPPPPPPSEDNSGQEGSSAPAPAPLSVSVAAPTATPNAEGIIYSEVQPGDSIWALAARAGITLDEILEMNDLSRDDLIRAGELLITGYGDPPAEETEAGESAEVGDQAEAPDEASQEGEETEEEQSVQAEAAPIEESPDSEETTDETEGDSAPTSSETANAATGSNSTEIEMIDQSAAGASVCLKAYNDANQNGRQDAGETLRPAVAFTISDGQSVVSNYVSDGVSEPFCIKGLSPGAYRITRSSLPNEQLTTSGDQRISLSDASTLNLEFGSVVMDTAATEQTGTESSDSAQGSNGDGIIGVIAVIAVVVAVLLLVGVLAIIFLNRRAPA